MCDEINHIDNNNYEQSLFPQLFYRSSENIKSELTVSNLIQFIPNTQTYDFEIELNNQSNKNDQKISFLKAQSLMQSKNHRLIKIYLNIEKNSVKRQEFIKDCFNLASKFDINMIFNFYINSFIQKFNGLLANVNYVKPIIEKGFDLKIEFDNDINSKSAENEEKILGILDMILDNIIMAFENLFKIGNIGKSKLFKLISMLNYEFDNEHNPINYLIASLVFKYLKRIVVKFDINSSNSKLIHYNTSSQSLIIFVKLDSDSIKKSINFLSEDEISNYFCTKLIKKEMHFISNCFANPYYVSNSQKNQDIAYDNRKNLYCNSNLPNLLIFLYKKKYFKRVEFLNKLIMEKNCKNREKILICLVTFELIIYLSISTIILVKNLNKNSFMVKNLLKCVLDFKNVDIPNKDTFILNINLKDLQFIKLITSNYNVISSVNGQVYANQLLDCSINYKECIIPLKYDTNMLKIRLLYQEDLNDYMRKVRISSENVKLRCILINSSTMEDIYSSSASICIEKKLLELMFTTEKGYTFKPQKYFLKTYLNECLVFESQVVLVSMNDDNVFYPMINSLLHFSMKLLVNDAATFLINNTIKEYLDIKVKFKPQKMGLRPITFHLSERHTHQINKFLKNHTKFLTKWLNSNVLFVNFSSSLVSEFYFSMPNNLSEPHLVYNLKENQGLNVIKYVFGISCFFIIIYNNSN